MDLPAKTKRQLEQDCLQSVLRALRQEAGMRQVDLALRLNEPQSFVSKYESGERRLDVLELRDICAALSVTVSLLVDRLEDCIRGTA